MKTHKKITLNTNEMTVEVHDGLQPGPMNFAAKIRRYYHLTPSTIQRIASVSCSDEYIPGYTSTGFSVARKKKL